MNEFQKHCWSACKQRLDEADWEYTGPIQVDGNRETYFIVQLSQTEETIELFIYTDEAGVMIRGKEWTIFEAPDFDNENELIAAVAGHVDSLVSV